jgi:hypothetical protein
METKKIQHKLKKGYGIATLNEEELKYLQKPIGKEIYKQSLEESTNDFIDNDRIKVNDNIKRVGRPRLENPGKYSDKIKCKICGQIVSRSNQSNHKRSQRHQIYLKMNEKIRKLLLEEK